MKARQGYIKGMQQDAAKSKYNPNSYYEARNWRVVTEGGLSTGVIENEKGHSHAFCVPDLAEMTLSDGTVIPAQSDLQIIGWGTINDTIIIFTTNETVATPTNSYGQIWKLKFDEETETVTDLDANGCLDPNIHLLYNQQVNFSSYHRIGRVVGRYETATKQRIYWTDNNNPVRTFNIADDDPLNISLENLDLQPGVTFTQPVVRSVGSGNLPEGTVIQFAYQLVDTNGGESLYSPTSALYPLPATDLYSGDFGDFLGNGSGAKTKSVTYVLKGLDTDYDVINHIAIIYSDAGTPTIYKFDEQFIPDTGEIEVTCSDVDSAIEITLTEFNLLSSGFDVAKDIEVKDNRLIAANTRTERVDIDFDARAYRFNSLGQAALTGASTLVINSPTDTVPEDHDAINQYNDESNVGWDTGIFDYKYQSDGVTLGGEGPNVSYKFTTISLGADFQGTSSVTTEPDHVSVGRTGAGNAEEPVGGTYPDGSDKTTDRDSQFVNNASGYAPAYFRGYARGEVYRFGIVFYTKKGTTSFVEWIGDIKMPEPTDGYPLMETVNGVPTLYQVGIEFTVDVSSIEDKISGFSIVRVKREEADRTKLGSGMLMMFDKYDNSRTDSLIHRWEGVNDGTLGTGNPWPLDNKQNVFGTEISGGWHLADRPGFLSPQVSASSAKRLAFMITPLGNFYSNTFKAGDFTKTTGYYSANAHAYYLETSNPDVDKSFGFYYKLQDYVAPTHGVERYQLHKARTLKTGEYVLDSDSLIGSGSFTGGGPLFNTSYSRSAGTKKNIPLGLGNPKLATIYTDTPTIANNSGDATGMSWHAGGAFPPNFSGDISTTTAYFKEVFYCRYVSNQYGGNNFESRSVNQYISTNHYQAVNTVTGTSFTFNVFGGDTFVNYYDDEYIQFFWNRATAYKDPYDEPKDNKLSVAVVCPVESPVNTNYRNGRNWAADRGSGPSVAMGDYESNSYAYNPVFSQENTIEEKFFAKDFLSEFSAESPTKLWASENKINGELRDSWRIFKTANATEVNGTYGPINRIINFRDRLYFYQDAAFGTAAIDERSIVQDSSGQEITLGTGGVFPDYAYISTETGSIHQFAVTASERALYHFDARRRKLFRFAQGPEPLSDLKGISSWLDNNVYGSILDTDLTLRADSSKYVGVHASPDLRYNRVLFTFLANKPALKLVGGTVYNEGDIILQGGVYYQANNTFTTPSTPALPSSDPDNWTPLQDKNGNDTYVNGETISYNEMLEAFESFYDYKPTMYLEYGRRLLSVSPYQTDNAYVHNVGNYGEFHGRPAAASTLNMLLTGGSDTTKIFNNIEYQAELYDSNGEDIFDETIDSIRFYNEYQDTGVQALTVDTDIKRRMRTWRYAIPRDNTDGKSRMRNPWIHMEFKYNNNSNKRHIIHDIIYSVTPSPF